MSRIFKIWALCGFFTILWQNSYNMGRFKTKLPDLEQFVGGSIFAINAKPEFPNNMNYTAFLKLYTDRGNMTAMSNNSTKDPPMMAYFPDFCADCIWSVSAGDKTCQQRVFHLQSRYKTPNAEEALMKQSVVCRNPPLQIFWKDDGIDELDSIFTLPRISRGNVTTSPIQGNISIYFYENLRKDVGSDLVENVRKKYAQRNNTDTNGQADIAIIDLFRTFPGRTDDPKSADIFVVPYPHASHCISKPTGVWLASCKHIAYDQVKGGVFDKLNHYVGNKQRHLFLNVINQGNSNSMIRDTHLSLNIGPRYKKTNILVPYLNNLPSFQPSAIRERGRDWWTRPRTYAMTYFFGVSNSKMRTSPRKYRQEFMEEVQKNWPDTLGSLPYAIRVMTRGKKPPSRLFTHMYKDSIFCPTFPGDTAPQKRFFDVIMMGCIPVVLEFESGERKSWHQPGGNPIEDSYPWIKGSGSVHQQNEIDYRSFVVVVTGGVKNVKPTIEALMQNYTEIRRRQLAVMKYAPFFTYGVGADAHKYPDAFSKILESLKFYVDGM